MVLSSTPSAWRFVATPRRKARHPCQLGIEPSRSNSCPSFACVASGFAQTAQRVRAETIARLTRSSRLRGFPFPAWRMGRCGCAQLVFFEGVGQLPNSWNGSLAAAPLWLTHRGIPDRPSDTQLLAVEVLPTQAPNLSFAKTGESCCQHNRSLWLSEKGEHRCDFGKAIGVSIFGSWSGECSHPAWDWRRQGFLEASPV